MKQERKTPPPIGAASLFTSFAVLLLTMLALLSLSQARSDRRLAEKTAAAVQDVYAADLEAQRIFAKLKNGEIPEAVTEERGIWCYGVPVSRYQTLSVEIDAATGSVLRWQMISHPEAPNDNLAVWAGRDEGE